MSTDFKCKNTFEDVLDEKFALGEAMKDSEPLKSSFFMVSRVSFVNRASVSRAFMLSFMLLFFFFFSSIECHMCRSRKKKVYLYNQFSSNCD